MKNLTFILLAFVLMSAAKPPKAIEVKYHTSAECGECKERIEGKLNYTKGIIFSELNYKTQELTVKFNPSKISEAQVQQIVSDLGYDIGDLKANPVEQAKLPACCLPGGMSGHQQH